MNDPRALRSRPLPTSTLARIADALAPQAPGDRRRLSPGQRLVERAVNTAVAAPIVGVGVTIVLVAELLDRLPDPRVVLWLGRNARMRRIR